MTRDEQIKHIGTLLLTDLIDGHPLDIVGDLIPCSDGGESGFSFVAQIDDSLTSTSAPNYEIRITIRPVISKQEFAELQAEWMSIETDIDRNRRRRQLDIERIMDESPWEYDPDCESDNELDKIVHRRPQPKSNYQPPSEQYYESIKRYHLSD